MKVKNRNQIYFSGLITNCARTLGKPLRTSVSSVLKCWAVWKDLLLAVLVSKIILKVAIHYWTARKERIWSNFTGFLIHIFIWKLLLKYVPFWLEQTEYSCSFFRHDCHEGKNYNQVLIKLLLQAAGILYLHRQRGRQNHYVHAFLQKITVICTVPVIFTLYHRNCHSVMNIHFQWQFSGKLICIFTYCKPIIPFQN